MGYHLHANLSPQSETVKAQCSLVWYRYCLLFEGVENLGGDPGLKPWFMTLATPLGTVPCLRPTATTET